MCLVSTIEMFISDGLILLVFDTILGLIQFQVTFMTIIYYFKKIMSGILPNQLVKWSKIIHISYFVQSIVLVSIIITVVILKAQDPNKKFDCLEPYHIAFEVIILLSFISHAVIACVLRYRIS